MPEQPAPLVLSVVSHAQRALVQQLLGDLKLHVRTPFRLILTENVPESSDILIDEYAFPIDVIRNVVPKGFGANHNSALARSGNGWFCVLNPDIRLTCDPFPALLSVAADPRVGIVAPVVTGPDLVPEDHARNFPSLFTLIAKALGHRPRSVAAQGEAVHSPDWIAGMFMLLRCKSMRELGGFDERYFLYYEDVDLCARMRDRGLEVVVCAEASVIHAARRESHRNLRYAAWHFRSAVRFLMSRPRIAFGLKPARARVKP